MEARSCSRRGGHHTDGMLCVRQRVGQWLVAWRGEGGLRSSERVAQTREHTTLLLSSSLPLFLQTDFQRRPSHFLEQLRDFASSHLRQHLQQSVQHSVRRVRLHVLLVTASCLATVRASRGFAVSKLSRVPRQRHFSNTLWSSCTSGRHFDPLRPRRTAISDGHRGDPSEIFHRWSSHL